jgi:hypothetical protein
VNLENKATRYYQYFLRGLKATNIQIEQKTPPYISGEDKVFSTKPNQHCRIDNAENKKT